MMTTTCPHCGRAYANSVFPLHFDCCLHRPEIGAAVRVALADPDNPGYALGRRRFDSVAQRVSSRTLLREFGTWMNACKHFGLKPISAKPSTTRPATAKPRRVNPLDAPLSEAEAHACARRGMAEAATGYVHCSLRSVVAR